MWTSCEYLHFIGERVLKAMYPCTYGCTKLFLSMIPAEIVPGLAWVAFNPLPRPQHSRHTVIANALLASLTVTFLFSTSLQLEWIAQPRWRSIYWRISNWRGLWFPEEKPRGDTVRKQRHRRQGLWPSGRWRFRRIWFLWIQRIWR